MIPKITSGGTSFKGAAAYYLHDKNRITNERVAWTHTENLITNDPHKAWKVMAYTAKEAERLKEVSGQKMTGRKLSKPVFSYSLAWHPEQNPDKDHMLETAKKSLGALGLTEHEVIIIAHSDEPQRHVHLLVNRVHPLTGLASDTGNSKLKLSDFAREYERTHGKVYCKQRESNHRKRTQGERTMYCDPNIVEAWNQADSGRGFAAGLKEKGYILAQGRKRLVVVDNYGHTHNPVRHLENVRSKQFNQRVADLDLSSLPDATQLSKSIQAHNRRRYEESLKHDERVIQRKNELQAQHLEERAQARNEYHDRLIKQRKQLTKYYRLREQQAEISALRKQTTNPHWLKKILGITRNQKMRLDTLQKTYDNANWRTQESLSQIETEGTNFLEQLKASHAAREKKALEAAQEKKPAGYANENERVKILESLRGKSVRIRNGPSLER